MWMLLYALFTVASAAVVSCVPAVKRLFLLGDSTMMPAQGELVGWGDHAATALANLGVHVKVENEAVLGMSVRTATEQGKISNVAGQVTHEDVVLFEYGRNDYYSSNNLGRAACPPVQGINSTCLGGKRTFEAYVADAARTLQSKGAYVVVASLLPLNPYGTPLWDFDPNEAPPYSIQYAERAARDVNTAFLDMYALVAAQYHSHPETTVNSFFGSSDCVHTNAAGAQFVAKLAAQALAPLMKREHV